MVGYGQGGYGFGGYGGAGTLPGFVPSLDYYLSLLASQYQNATNEKAWLLANLTPLAQAAALLGQLPFNFDPDTAIGAQLDILGLLIGAPRRVPFQPTNGVSPLLIDSVYRIFIKAKIAQNQWDGKIASLYPIWASLFPGGIISIQDNQNMTASITLAGAFSSITQDLITNGLIIPRPEGVEYDFIFATLPIFGCDQNNAYVAGADLGHCA